MNDKTLAEKREMLANLKLIIIDEVSMVSADMLYKIHLRLKEIFQTIYPGTGNSKHSNYY